MVWNFQKFASTSIYYLEKCFRVMFGNKDAYMDKFKTCARTRSFENGFLGKYFFQGEPSKPL